MKIGVITYWQSNDNYGQLLQCWALQRYLRSNGHDAYIIRYDFIHRQHFRKSLWKRLMKLCLIIPLFLHFYRKKKERRNKKVSIEIEKKNIARQFDMFRSENLKFSDKVYYSLKDLQTEAPKGEAYITGSDQVWRQLLNQKENEVFFLNFGNEKVKRIAYAASFGLETYPPKLNNILANNLKRFDAISVREYDGVNICKKVGISAIKVLDPTLLLSKEKYIGISSEPKYKNYIYIYSLNVSSPNELYFDKIKNVAKTNNLQIVVTPATGYIPGREIYDQVTYDYSTIPDWLSNINNAKLVVTTSFHGVVFCVIMHTPFIYVPLKGNLSKMNNRAIDLLTSIGLENRIAENENSIGNIIKIPINWDESEKKLNSLIQDSTDFLRESLK